MKTILIDDESDARSTLRTFLKHDCPEVNVIAEADGVQSGIRCINQHEPDLVFLDIQMEDGTGFDLLEQLKFKDFSVIFTTAFDNYAIKAFKYSAVDYLLKPIDPDELTEAVKKVSQQLSGRYKQIEELLLHRREEKPERITIPSSDGLTIIKLDDIIRLESDSNYTHFYLRENEKLTVPKSLKEYEEILPSDRFYRIHQSHLIQMKYVKRYVKEDGGYVVMEDGSQAYVSRRKKDDFLKTLIE